MAVRWRCPECGSESVENDPFGLDTVRCEGCQCEVQRPAALCFVCDAPGGLRARDSVHVQCRICGDMQMIFAVVSG